MLSEHNYAYIGAISGDFGAFLHKHSKGILENIFIVSDVIPMLLDGFNP